MRPLWWFLRRGTSIPLGLLVLGAVVGSVATNPDWHLELDWGLRLTSSTVAFVAPLVAASAAYETSRRHHPTVAAFARAGSRGPALHLIPAVGPALAASGGYVLCWVGITLTTIVNDGVGLTDPWVFPETLGPVLGAAAIGGMVGNWVRGIGAPVVAAAVVLSAAVLVSPWGRGPFEVVTTYGTLTGIERPPSQAGAAVVSALLTMALAASLCCMGRVAPWPRWTRIALLAAFVPIWVAPVAHPWPDQVFRVSSESVGCVGSSPSLCGPQSRLGLLRRAQPSFAAAYARLEGTPFDGPDAFRVTRLDHYSRLNGAAPLDFDPAGLSSPQGYPLSGVVAALLRPHQCRGLFDAQQSVPLLEAQHRISPWLEDVVSGRRPGQPVPPAVLDDFSTITSCDVFSGDLT